MIQMPLTKKLNDLFSLGASRLISGLIFGIFWLFLASLMEKNQYGELGYLMSIVHVATIVSLLGLPTTIVIYEAKKENIFPASIILGIISSIIAALISYIWTQNFVVSLLITGTALFMLISHGLISKERYRTYSYHFVLRAIVATVLALILFNFFGFNGILLGFFISTLLIIKELLPLIRNKKFEFSIIKSKIRFLVYIYSSRISQVLFNWGDKIVIASLYGFSTLGSYHFAFQYFLLLETIPRAAHQYFLPQEALGKKNKKLKIFTILISCIIAFASIILIPYGVNSILPKYQDSILPMQIMSIAIVPLAISIIQQTQFLGKENSKAVLAGGIIQSALYFLLIIILGETYGLMGLAIGLVTAVTVRTIFNQLASNYFKSEKPK